MRITVGVCGRERERVDTKDAGKYMYGRPRDMYILQYVVHRWTALSTSTKYLVFHISP